MEVLERMPWEARIAVFKKLADVASTAALTPEERDKYEYSLKKIRDELSIMSHERKQGIQQGRAEGIQVVARNLKNSGIPIDVIAQNTGLTVEEINNL